MYILPQIDGSEIIMYLRKSRADDPLLAMDEVLARHESMLNEWMVRSLPYAGTVPAENILREIVSGETLAERARMLDLLRRVESPRIKAVLCTEPSRLSRGSLKEIGHIVEILRYTNTIVMTLQYCYDLNDDRDRELFERELMRGNEYLQYSRKIMVNGSLASVAAGNFIAKDAPYGYRKISYKEKGRMTRTLEPIPEQAEAVKLMFEMYRDGFGTFKIADKLDELKYTPPRGDSWARESVASMLSNIHYIGKVKWGQRKIVRKVEDGQVVKSRPEAEEYLIFDGKHPAIIDMELWDAVQAKRGLNPKNKKDVELYNPLAGLLWCKRCGRALKAQKYPNKNGEGERCAPRYVCYNRTNCTVASTSMADVLDEVARVLRETLENFEMQVEEEVDDSKEVHLHLIERLEKKLNELKDLERKQWDEKIKGEIPSHVFKDLNTKTVAEIEEVEEALFEAKNTIPEPMDMKERVITFRAALDALQDPNAPAKEQNELLKACIERIEYERDGKGVNARWSPKEPIKLDITLLV